MKCQRSLVPLATRLRFVALVAVRESGGPIGPEEEPVDVLPSVGGRHVPFYRKVLVEKLKSALGSERSVDSWRFARVRRQALLFLVTTPEVSRSSNATAIALPRSGGTALPTCRYLEWAAPPSILPGNSPCR